MILTLASTRPRLRPPPSPPSLPRTDPQAAFKEDADYAEAAKTALAAYA